MSDAEKEFTDFFPELVAEFKQVGRHIQEPQVAKWMVEVLEFNVPDGKKNRGLMTVNFYKMLEKPENLTPENIRLVQVLGWCVEMVQSLILIMDDIMDGSLTRRGRPCWHMQPNVGLMALNDAMLVQGAMFSLLKQYFHDKPYYGSVLELFNEITFKTSIGQYLDMNTAFGDKPDLSKFTMTRYKSIAKYKTSYYTFQMPVSLALLVSGIENLEAHKQAEDILLQIGEYYQIQDDYLDCYGDPAVTGKIGRDIEEGKCTWLAVRSLQLANPAQMRTMEALYGGKDPDDVAKIKAVYNELAIADKFAAYEESIAPEIRNNIKQITTIPQALFSNLFDKIYNRKA